MGDPGFDLGTVSTTSELTESQDEEMLQAYCGGMVSDEFRARVVMYKAVCVLCWALWGFHQWALGIDLPVSRDGRDIVA